MASNKENSSPLVEMEAAYSIKRVIFSPTTDPNTASFFDCFCFRGVICCSTRRRTSNIGSGGGGGSDRRLLDDEKAEDESSLAAAVGKEDAWWVEKLKRVREMSEILAGPKWKNFIRKFGSNKKRRSMQYQYDPQSYALNFDDGIDREDGVLPDFAARYAAAPVVAATN